MDPQRNKERTLDAVAALNRGDLDGYLAIYAPGAVVHGLPDHLSADAAGHREFLAEIRQSLPDFRAKVEAVVAEDDLLAARITYSGTHLAPMRGVPPTGRVLTWEAMTFRRYDDEGQVLERWIVGDNLSLLHQLGLL
ncbi:MAG TPA: ester cyclase [Ornithinibacter sp.]|nr:ester cyclase [Ornithinibacter sp.]